MSNSVAKADLDRFFNERVVVWNNGESLDDILHKLESLEGVPDAFPLDYIVVSNVSIYYWEMRQNNDYSSMVAFDKLCTNLSKQYMCNIVSSMALGTQLTR